MRRTTTAVFGAALVILSGCSSGVEGTAAVDPAQQSWTVRQGLSWLPADSLDGLEGSFPMLILGDLDAATELADSRRPSSDASDDDIANWTIEVASGIRDGATVSAMLPDVVSPTSLAMAGEIRDELGWTVADVSSYAEIQAPPYRFAVLDGTFDEATITAAQGAPVDGIWRLGPDEDYAQDVSGRTAARRIGQSMRTALNDGRLAVSPETPAVTDWLAAPAGLDTHPGLGALADALDRQDVYSAMLLPDVSGFGGQAGDADVPPLLDRYETLGVGLSVRDGQAVMVLTFQFADDATAAANVDTLRAQVEEGVSYITMQPWAERLSVVDVSASGPVLTGVFAVVDGPPSFAWSVAVQRDSLLMYEE